MQYVLTNKQMRDADEYTIKTLGTPSLLLMERAGMALADEVEKMVPSGKIVCVCGGGNNGGDGFVCARVLKGRGREVSVVFYAEKLSNDCRVNMEKWTALGGVIVTEIPNDCALIVDCLYGTGFKGKLLNADMGAVLCINACKNNGVKILSADIPSGVNGENGRVDGVAVFADVTLCIGEIKTGAILGDGIDFAGKVKRVDIGIALPAGEYARLIEGEDVKAWLPKRKRNSHKGTYGKVAVVGGSVEYTGAPYLSSLAALRSGAGYVTLFTPSNLLPYYYLKSPELLLKSISEGGRYTFNEESMQILLDYNGIAYGMGMGISEEVALGAEWLLSHYEGKLILDADGLNSLSVYRKEVLAVLFKKAKCDVLLTPHCKEFSRISRIEVGQVLDEGLALAKALSEKWGVRILLKNAATIITDGKRTALNVCGSSGQAKGGSGDVLAGVIASLCAVGLSTYEAGVIGAYLTGTAAELAAQEWGEYSLTPSDVISYLGKAFLSISLL